MTSSELTRALWTIKSKDPGVASSPQMLQEHQEWAIATYGTETWKTYLTTSWDKRHDS